MVEHLVWLFSAFLIIATVTVHYEVMMLVSDKVIPCAQKQTHSRRVISIAITGLLLGHIIEIWIFALAMWVLLQIPILGTLQGGETNLWSDCLYLSSVNYTSLGDGSLRMTGPARAIASAETLAGLMMIAWSASFTYLKMEQIWRNRGRKQ